MVWRQIGDSLLLEPMLTQFIGAYMPSILNYYRKVTIKTSHTTLEVNVFSF